MKYSKRIVKKIIADVSEGYTIKEICIRCGIARQTFFEWRDNKPDFSDLLKAAEEQKWATLAGSLEPSIKKLAEGYRETYMEKTGTLSKEKGPNGEPKIEVTEVKEIVKVFPPQSNFVQFLMKNLIPEKFSDKSELKLTGDVNVSNTGFSLKVRGVSNPDQGITPGEQQEESSDDRPE